VGIWFWFIRLYVRWPWLLKERASTEWNVWVGNRILVPLLRQSHWWALVTLCDCCSFEVVAYTNIYTDNIYRQTKKANVYKAKSEWQMMWIYLSAHCSQTSETAVVMFHDSQASLTFPSGTSYVDAMRQKPEGRGSDSRWGK